MGRRGEGSREGGPGVGKKGKVTPDSYCKVATYRYLLLSVCYWDQDLAFVTGIKISDWCKIVLFVTGIKISDWCKLCLIVLFQCS